MEDRRMVNNKLKAKKNNGFRDGVDKEDIVSLTKEEKQMIKLKRDIENSFIKNKKAYHFAVRNDQMYHLYLQGLSNIDSTIYEVLSIKTKVDRNSHDIIVGTTDRVYPGSANKMSLRDLEIENIHAKRMINEGVRKLWVFLADVYRYVGVHRIDKVVFFSEEEYNKKVEWVESELKKNGINLYEESQK